MVNVFSFCLYGPPNPRYYPVAMLQNIDLIGIHFPGWKVYIYIAPDVDPEFTRQVAMYSNVVLKPTGKLGSINMVERFFAIDEPDVDIMFVRDADSRVHYKDRWAINDFLRRPEFIAHAIRDHPEHSACMMGGMWGLRKIDKISISNQYTLYSQNPIDCGYGIDQSFLKTYVYPYVRARLLVHIGGKAPGFEGEYIIRFPFPHSQSLFCGRCDELSFRDIPPPTPDLLSLLKGRR